MEESPCRNCERHSSEFPECREGCDRFDDQPFYKQSDSKAIPDKIWRTTKKKQCSRCRKSKPIEDFEINLNCKDGRAGVCKECRAKRGRELRDKRRAKMVKNEEPVKRQPVDKKIIKVDLRNYPKVYEALERYAMAELRTPENQLLWLVITKHEELFV